MDEKDMRTRAGELRKELEEASKSYYNTGIELMSNKEYDAKFDELKALEEALGIKDGFTSKVGSEVSSKLKKVEHKYEAKSLGKTKDIEEIISAQSDGIHNSVCLSWKLDGSTVQATYKDGKLVLSATRGDGRVGQNITENSVYINGLPQEIPFKGSLVVRGEAIMSYEEFDRLNADGQYANPRNLANATITALDREILQTRNIIFNAFELVDTDGEIPNNFSERLDWLKEQGFSVVEHISVPIDKLKETMAGWTAEKAYPYPVDGLVVANNDCEFTKNLTGTEHHPNLMKGMAFKWQDETAETVLREIEWSPSRTGLLNPVAVFDTVDLCGTKVSRASLHNVSYVDALKLKIGDRITVYKANMIIPQIDENLDRDKEGMSLTHDVSCPCCKTKAEIRFNYESGTKVMVCPNDDCPEKTLGRLTHFVSKHGMNIEGLSEKTLKTLLDNNLIKNLNSIYDLYKHRDEIERLEGFGKKATENLLNAIEKSKTSDFQHIMYAFGIPNFGRGQIKVLKEYIDTISPDERDRLVKESKSTWVQSICDSENYPDVLIAMYIDGFDFSKINGIGTVLAKNLEDWIDNHFISRETGKPRFGAEFVIISTIGNFLIDYKPPLEKEGLTEISGQTFCITGSLETFKNRDECIAYIESKGGKFVTSVSSKTKWLVNNDITSTSGKNKKAHELGIPIITEKELLEMGETLLPFPYPEKELKTEEKVAPAVEEKPVEEKPKKKRVIWKGLE